ncbi:MAG: PAS domain S-box protein [Desulfovibrionaceae bacterium]
MAFEHQLRIHTRSLTSSIDSRFALLLGLEAFAQSHMDIPDHMQATFPAFAANLAHNASGIINMSIAPKGVQWLVHPHNPRVVGHDLVHDTRPMVRDDVARTIRTGRVALSGPYPLRQGGGLALIARKALFRDDTFWGLVTMVLSVPHMIEASELTADDSIAFALSKPGAPSPFYTHGDFQAAWAITIPLTLEEGTWELACHPTAGWEGLIHDDLVAARIAALLIIALAASLAGMIAGRHQDLTFAVAARTGELTAANARLTQEIDTRTRAEASLSQSEARFRQLVESMTEVFWMQDVATGAFVYMSPAFATVWGMPVQAALDDPEVWLQAIHPDDREGMVACMEHARTSPDNGSQAITFRIVRPDGEMRWGSGHCAPVRIPGQPIQCITGIAEDITERRNAQELAVQSEKMLSLGRLAAGMAHEINNPLCIILQGLQTLERRVSPDLATNIALANEQEIDLEQVMRYLRGRGIPPLIDNIRQAGLRAADIIANLTNYCRSSKSGFGNVDINALVIDALHYATGERNITKGSPPNVRVTKNLAPDLCPVRCDKHEIHQVLITLCLYALHALDGNTNDPRLTVTSRQDNGNAVLSIADNGPGLDEQLKTTAFEPFNTLPRHDDGKGLGLATAYFIVTFRHQGVFQIDSAPGAGTTFTFSLPCAPPSAS